MSFLVNTNGVVLASDLPANSITAAMIAANAATTTKFADKSATLNKFANDAKAALISPAAAALATLLAETAANRAGFIGDFYLADDFESDSLATSTNSIYANSYYSNPADYLVGGAWNITSGTFTQASDGVVDTEAATSLATFDANISGDFVLSFNWADLGASGAAFEVGVYPRSAYPISTVISLDGNARGVDYLVVHDRPDAGQIRFIQNGSVQASTSRVLTTFKIKRVGTTYTVTDGADSLLHTFSSPSAGVDLSVGASSSSAGSGAVENITLEVAAGAGAAQTLAPTPVTLATANPTDLIAFVLIDPQEAITVGTDITMSMSIDGGTTDAVGTWTSLGSIGGSNLELYSVEADVSAQAGSSLTYEILTANNKEIRLHQLVGIKAFY